MDPLTAGLNLVKVLADNHLAMFNALDDATKTTYATAHFDRMDKLQDLAERIISIFHKEPA